MVHSVLPELSSTISEVMFMSRQMFDVYLRAYKDTRLAKQLTKQIIDNMLSRLHIGGRAFAERYEPVTLRLLNFLNVSCLKTSSVTVYSL